MGYDIMSLDSLFVSQDMTVMGMRMGCDVLCRSRILDQMMRAHLQHNSRHLFPTRSLCRSASAR